MDKDIIIDVKNISKIYKLYDKPIDRLKEALSLTKKVYHREHYALHNITFQVKRGETIGIIGSNGSGKSTLLKIITNIITPSRGEVNVRGRISALLELGAGFNPEYTGLENIYINGTMMGYNRKEMEKKVDDIVNFADIGEFIDQPVKTYSSGMFARLAFAVAINVEPDVLIVDEALSVGDVFFQNKCFRKFDELKKKGVTILFVSHDIGSIKQMCSKVLWIEHGQQRMFGDKREVCNAYNNSMRVKNGLSGIILNNTNDHTEYIINKIELDKYPPIRYSQESVLNPDVRIISCFFKDMSGNIVNDLEVGQNYTFVSIFETKIDISKCITGFVIETPKGQWIINCNSAICGRKSNFFVPSGSLLCSEFHFQLPRLMKGEYIVGTAVSDGDISNFHVLTWLYQAIKINIANYGQNSGVIDIDADVDLYYVNNDKLDEVDIYEGDR